MALKEDPSSLSSKPQPFKYKPPPKPKYHGKKPTKTTGMKYNPKATLDPSQVEWKVPPQEANHILYNRFTDVETKKEQPKWAQKRKKWYKQDVKMYKSKKFVNRKYADPTWVTQPRSEQGEKERRFDAILKDFLERSKKMREE